MAKDDSCPKGMIKRKGYTANRRGKQVKVAASCIRATSASGLKRSPIDKAYLAQRAAIHEKLEKKYGSKKCPPGQIERSGFTKGSYERRGYYRKNGTYVHPAHVSKAEVAPVCVRDIGAPGKGFKIPVVLEKGVLKRVGYADVKNLTVQQRHNALSRAYNELQNPLSLFRKLVVVSTMNKNKDPDLAKIFKTDANWVKDQYGLLVTPPHYTGKPKRSSKTAKQYAGSKTANKTKPKAKPKKTSGSKTSKPKATKSKATKSKATKRKN